MWKMMGGTWKKLFNIHLNCFVVQMANCKIRPGDVNLHGTTYAARDKAGNLYDKETKDCLWSFSISESYRYL